MLTATKVTETGCGATTGSPLVSQAPSPPPLLLPTADTLDAGDFTAAHAGQKEQELPTPDPPGSDNVLVEHAEEREDPATSGDTPRVGLLPQLGAAGPGEDEDEQLRAVSGSAAARRGDIPGANGTALPPATTSSPAWPHEDEALNVVDQAPGSTRQDPAGSSPAPAVQEAPGPEEPPVTLLPRSQSPAQEATSSPTASPGLGTVPGTAAETPSTPLGSSRAPRRSSYAGLNGRYFQLQRQSRDPPVAEDPPVTEDPPVAGDPTMSGDPTVAGDPTGAGDPMGTATHAPILALEVKGAAANAVETWSIAHTGAESPPGGGPYPLSNEVEDEIGHSK